MTHKREALTIMDSATTFGIQNRISISRITAISIVLAFIGCLIATGLLVYYLTSCSESGKTKIETKSYHQCNHTVFVSATATSIYNPEITSTEIFREVTSTVEPKTETPIDLRLPKSIIPHSYYIKLIPFLNENNFTFHGDISILINVTFEVGNITLHTDELVIDKTSIIVKQFGSNATIEIKSVDIDKKRQFLIIHLGETLQVNQYVLDINFKGILNDTLQGFYRSSYKEGNETR